MSTVQTKPFLDDARSAVHGLRRALADVLSSVQANPDEPQEISRRFGLDKTLTWRIARVIRAEDPSEAVPHLPRPPSILIFVRAMSKHGAPQERVDSVITALNQFERFVEVHSGDRETLEMMLGASPKRTAAKRMEAFRKSGFQANSATWGVRAALQIGSQFMSPSARDPLMIDMATICGFSGFRRLRPDVPWSVATLHGWRGESSPELDHPSVVDAMEPISDLPEIPLLEEFCSHPLPDMRVVEERPGTRRFMLAEGPIGNTAAASVFMGWLMRDAAPIHESEPGEHGDHLVNLSTPVEELIHDLFIHRDFEFAMEPMASVYSQMPGGPQFPTAGKEAAKLPVPVEVIDLGEGPPDTTTPELPRYREMVSLAAERLGHSLDDFRAFRYRLRYPPIPSMSCLRHPLLRPL